MKIIQTYCCYEHLKEQTELGKSLNRPVREIPIFDTEKGKIVCSFCLMGDIYDLQGINASWNSERR